MEKDLNLQLQESLTILTAIAAENNNNAMRVINEVEQQERKLYKKWNVLGLLHSR